MYSWSPCIPRYYVARIIHTESSAARDEERRGKQNRAVPCSDSARALVTLCAQALEHVKRVPLVEVRSPNMVDQADQLLAALEISGWKQRGMPPAPVAT